MKERYSVGGKGSYSLEEAKVIANRIHEQTGNIVAIEKKHTIRFNVIVHDEDGRNSVLDVNCISEWTKKTAIKHAQSFNEITRKHCSVIDASEPIHLAKPVFTTKTD